MASCTEPLKKLDILESGDSFSRNDSADTLDTPSPNNHAEGEKNLQYGAHSPCESNDPTNSPDLESGSTLSENDNPFFGLMKEKITTEMLEDIYTEMRFAIDSCQVTSAPSESSFSNIHHYLEEVIPLSWESKKICARKAFYLTPLEMVLDVRVIEAEKIKRCPRYDRLVCQLWMDDLVEDRKVTRAVKFCTRPVWNSTHRLEVEDCEDAELAIEVRKVRCQVEPTESNCFALRLPKYLAKRFKRNRTTPPGDRRIGVARLPLKSIPCEGCNSQKIQIRSLSSNRIKGYIRVATTLSTNKKSEENVTLKRHLILNRICVEEALKDVSKSTLINSWDQFVPSDARSLITLHSFMDNMSLGEIYICRFIVVSEIFDRGYPVSYQFVYELLLECEKEIRHLSSRMLNSFLKEVYDKEAKIFIRNCVNVIENLHSFDISENKIHRMKFEFSLRIINLCNGFLGVWNDPIIILKSESAGWFEKLRISVLSLSENQANELIELMQNLIDFQTCADNCVERVFPEMTYSAITCEAMENLLEQSLKSIIQKISHKSLSLENDVDRNPTEAISLFVSVRNLIEYTSKAVKSPYLGRSISKLCNWFGSDVIQQWFSWRTKDAIVRIEMILHCSDTTEQISDINGEGRLVSASVDAVCRIIRHNLVNLWLLVSRPSSHDFSILLLNGLFDCCKAYANKLKNISSEPGDMKNDSVRKRYFILANDIQAITEFIDETVAVMMVKAPSDGEDSQIFVLIHGFRYKVVALLTNALGPLADKRVAKVAEADSKHKQERMVKKYRAFLHKVLWEQARKHMLVDVFRLFLSEFCDYVKRIILARAEKQTSTIAQWNPEELLEILKNTEKMSCLDENREMVCDAQP